MTVTDLPPAWELTPDSFYAWCVENHATERGFTAPDPVLIGRPRTTVDEVAPPTWDAYVGQADAVDEVRTHVVSAQARSAALPATLLVAPAGFGKTTLARLIANELGRPLVEITRPTQADKLAEQLMAAGPGPVVVFVDEVHLWKAKAQQDLMDLADTASVATSSGVIDFPGLSLIAATTEPHLLIGPLIDRFVCTPHFGTYTDTDMAIIVAGMAYRAGLEPDQVTREFQDVLGRASAGHPRSARHLVVAARALADNGRDCTAGSVLAFTRTDTDGMTDDHLTYLATLNGANRDLGLSAMAHLLGQAQGTVTRTERLLLERGYIALGVRGRQITPAGRRRLSP